MAALGEELIPVDIEVRLSRSSVLRPSDVQRAIRLAAEERTGAWLEGDFQLKPNDTIDTTDAGRGIDAEANVLYVNSKLLSQIQAIRVCDLPAPYNQGSGVPSRIADVQVHVYQLCEDGPSHEDLEGEEGGGGDVMSAYVAYALPSSSFEGLWDSLLYSSSIKETLLSYADTTMRFAEAGVNSNLISWNHVVLLHGPPGTGKTSLAKSLSHKLSIKLSGHFAAATLIEINAHSLFSRWFSESGKTVARLFAHIQELVEDESQLIFVLIDEVESLTSARKSALNGSEPSDAIRVVNAVLTAVDALKARKNVMILTTSNVSEAIDVAFVDRADVRLYVGPPTAAVRYNILSSTLSELMRTSIAAPEVAILRAEEAEAAFASIAHACHASSIPESVVADAFMAFSTLAHKCGPGTTLQSPSCANIRFALASSGAPVSLDISNTVGKTPSACVIVTPELLIAAVLFDAALKCEGSSGRGLRKLPLQAHARFLRRGVAHPLAVAKAFLQTAVLEAESRGLIAEG